MKEYLDPTDWSLKLVNVDNDAAQPHWIEVPEGAELLVELPFSERATGQNKAFYKENFKYAWVPALFKKWIATHPPRKFFESFPVLWRRQKPRIRVYATLSQSKFEQVIAMAEAAADWSALGWREAARKRVLEKWQPDWTWAPKGCDWFAVDSDGTGTFMNYEPEMLCGTWVAPSSTTHPIIKARLSTNFGYQGDWRDSLRKCKKIGGVIIL